MDDEEGRELAAEAAAALDRAGWHPAVVHAVRTLGYWVTAQNWDTFTDRERQAWDDTIRSWCTDHNVPMPVAGSGGRP